MEPSFVKLNKKSNQSYFTAFRIIHLLNLPINVLSQKSILEKKIFPNSNNFDKIKKIKIVFISCLFSILFSNISFPQVSHYWNIQYGTRATLLGGAVIGSASDLSATYYNPGAVVLFQDSRFILSTEAYQLDNYTVKDGVTEGKDLEYSTINPAPRFIGFDFDFSFLGDDKLVLSILTRQSSNFDFSATIVDSIDILENSPGNEKLTAGVDIEKIMDDVWTGFTYSTKLSEKVGLGATLYFAYRYHSLRQGTIIQALKSSGDIASGTDIVNYKYNNLRSLLKAGMGINLNPLTLGFTVTTPSVNIFGSGYASTHFFISGVETETFASNFQDEVKSNYNTPWSFGIGGSYQIKKVIVHVSAEWYDAVDKYFVLDTDPYRAQGSGEIKTNDLTHEAASIINYGIGLDYFVNEKFIISGSFVTDFSAQVKNTATNLSPPSSWNIFHLSAGSTFWIAKSEITVGLGYSFGSEIIQNDIDLTPPSAGEEPTLRNLELSFTRIKLLLGFVL